MRLACLEGGPVSVDKELMAARVPVARALARVAEQRVGVAAERAQLRLVALTADVDHDALTPRLRAVVRGGRPLPPTPAAPPRPPAQAERGDRAGDERRGEAGQQGDHVSRPVH